MKVAALFPIGTSDGGCPVAIGEILKEEPAIDVYLLYGTRGAADAPDPKDFVARIVEAVTDKRVTWAGNQEVEPFRFSEAYLQIRAFVASIAEKQYDRVWVGITGGSNPVVTSLFQTAMAYLACQVVPIYVQARGTTPVQHFVASEARDSVVAEEVLGTARAGQVRVAARLAERLPLEGNWKVLRRAVEALAYWDDFDYDGAAHELKMPARKAGDLAGNALLVPLAGTVSRLAAEADEMSAFAKKIRDTQGFDSAAMGPEWGDRVARAGVLLVGDVLANAQRRIVEGRFTDSVLRSYRAAECATQMRLLALGIHPARTDACQTAYLRYQAHLAAEAGGMAFNDGLKFLGSIGAINLDPIRGDVAKLSSARNYTYLEHGYVRVEPSQAARCFDMALSICEHLLGAGVRDAWPRFEMRF
jgi:hypothetical protein